MTNLPEREEAIKRLLEGSDNSYNFQDISNGLSKLGWTVHPVKYQNIIVGAILEKEGEIHTSISPDYQKRWNPRPYIKSILLPALHKYGTIHSDADKYDFRAIRWLVKLGFEFIREENDRYYYKMIKSNLKIT